MCDKRNYPKPLPVRPKARRLLPSEELRDYSPAGIYGHPDSDVSSVTESDSCPCDQPNGPTDQQNGPTDQQNATSISSSLPWQGNPIIEPLPQIVIGTCSPDCKGRQDSIPRISRDFNDGYQQNSARNSKRVSIQEQGFETSDLIPSDYKPATTSMQGGPARPSFDPNSAPCNSYCRSCNNSLSAAPIQDQTADVISDLRKLSTTMSVDMPALDPRSAPKVTCCESCSKPLPVVPNYNQTNDVLPECCKPSILRPGPEPAFNSRTAPKEPCCESCKNSVLVAPIQKNECDDYCAHDTCGKEAFNNEGSSQETEDESAVPPKIKLWNMPLGTPPPRKRSKSASIAQGEQTDSDKTELDGKRLSKDGQNKRASQDSGKRNSTNEDVKKVPSKGLVKKRNSKN
uniref:Uncharacterized protein n=2 Tax=Heliothis virescens TaxID=7102 RepID=A0A2A4IYD6_HELVI